MKPREVIPLDVGRATAHSRFPLVHVGLEVDFDGRILRSRPGAVESYGLRTPNVVGEYASDLFVADDVLSARALLHRASRGGATTPILLRMRRVDGAELVVRVSAHISDRSIQVRIREGDATERNIFYAASSRRARFDPLTGLPNRLLLLERAGASLASGPQTLVLIDVDRFRHLVTALGPRVGDRILVEIGDRLVSAMGANGLVGLSGGQFAVLVPDDSTMTAIPSLIARVRAAICAPLVANGEAIVFDACLGIATSDADAEALFADAEVAVAQAKSLGPAHDAIFDPAFRRRAVRQIELQSDLSRAVAGKELRLDYQPIVQLDTDEVVGYEALVRWQHPSRGRLAPSEFLGIAQRSGAGAAIDDWVLTEACRQAARWAQSGHPTTICVNVAPERFALEGFVERVECALNVTGLDPAQLVVEITEWSILADVTAARHTLGALKALGVRVALDDFGTGYSSLSDIAALAVDELKIDTSFVAGLGSDRARTAIVRAIVGLGHALDIAVVAEGIESAAQAFALRALGCEFGQGFHFGRPASQPTLVSRTS
ncbi:MAG TPA: EAL domain-containing protein [Acidimicrobiia bacterium]|nr:EAL domain-containing protein [Acidimicrobiia bacterium]